MGTLLNRRRYMGGGGSLPYDAEVEYLQSDGNQWIELGIYGSNDLDFTIDFEPLDLTETNRTWTGTGAYFGGYRTYGKYYCLAGYNRDVNKKGCFFYASYGEAQGGTITIGLSSQRTIVSKSGLVLTTAVDTQTLPSTEFTDERTLAVFATKYRETVSHKSKMKLYSLKFSKNDVAILDLVPVRVGQVGYLYDKVSNTLFANEGSVNFTLGPDKTT